MWGWHVAKWHVTKCNTNTPSVRWSTEDDHMTHSGLEIVAFPTSWIKTNPAVVWATSQIKSVLPQWLEGFSCASVDTCKCENVRAGAGVSLRVGSVIYHLQHRTPLTVLASPLSPHHPHPHLQGQAAISDGHIDEWLAEAPMLHWTHSYSRRFLAQRCTVAGTTGCILR